MRRKQDIEVLLKRCKDDFVKIEAKYNAALHAQQIGADLRIDIKNFCENLRSVLDYLAHEIREKHCLFAASEERCYFPIIGNKQAFDGQVEKWYPDLKKNAPTIWSYLESVQPYNQAYSWLGSFNRLNNENKHGKLAPQTRKETEQVRVSFSGGSVAWNRANVRFGAGVSIGGVPVDPATQMPIPHPSQKVERVIWVDFRFDGEDASALQLLVSFRWACKIFGGGAARGEPAGSQRVAVGVVATPSIVCR